jgi:hypothetical protein
VLVNGDPNPNRPDLPHYGAGETMLKPTHGGDRERRLRCDGSQAAESAVQGAACAARR